jgi:hypothetical protein
VAVNQVCTGKTPRRSRRARAYSPYPARAFIATLFGISENDRHIALLRSWPQSLNASNGYTTN